MKRLTQYLYEYQREKRIRNIGFVKVEPKENSCVLRMQGRGLEGKVYLFYKNEDGYEAVYQGELSEKKLTMSYTLEFTGEDIGNADSMEDIAGLMLTSAYGRRYAAIWNGEIVDVDTISTEIKEKATLLEEPEVIEQVETEEIEIYEDIEPEPEPENVYEKIQRKDLARLPRKDWRLANNNFLLHGFYNYHHLLWIEEDGELYIGVPGVNHAREVQAAQAFGFTQFRRLEDTNLELSENESNPREDFGYFCRRIARNE